MNWDAVHIVTYILNFIIIIITFYLIFLLIKSNSFKRYPCYNITILSFVIFSDNILRIIPSGDIKALENIQAFLLTFLDKILLTSIVSQSIITYFGVCKNKFYFEKNNERNIFFTLLIMGIIISVILSLLYLIKAGTVNYGTYFYCHDSDAKRISDTIFNGIFLLINSIIIVLLLIYISKKKNEASLGLIGDLDYGHHHTRIILMFIINSLLFIESYLIIYDKFPTNEVDLIYLITCLIVLSYYTINKIIIEETMKIFCQNYYNKKYPNINKNEHLTDGDYDEDDESDHKVKNKGNDSFSDD